MSKIAHRIFLITLVIIVSITFIWLLYRGLAYYNISLEERVFHQDHGVLKPSGFLGHGFGIAGSLFMITGMISYMARKRYRFLSRVGLLKHWLEFHIFLCTLGPILVLFHTSFKFGGLVAISFWSMVAVFLSGIVGRFIYLQIPRSREGRELTLNEVKGLKSDVAVVVRDTYNLDSESFKILSESISQNVDFNRKNPLIRYLGKYFDDRQRVKEVKLVLRKFNLPRKEFLKVISLVKEDIRLNSRIERLDKMQKLFEYWHVAHLPFALVMLIIMVIHVGVTILFGYRWIF